MRGSPEADLVRKQEYRPAAALYVPLGFSPSLSQKQYCLALVFSTKGTSGKNNEPLYCIASSLLQEDDNENVYNAREKSQKEGLFAKYTTAKLLL